jgi:hypothetical protein
MGGEKQKKTISSILIFSMIFGFFVPFLLFPKPAKALFGVGDSVVIVFETPNVLIARKTTNVIGDITVKNIVHNVLLVIWETVRLRMINYLANVIVRWIYYGPNDRKPQFVSNFGDFIGGAIEDSVGRFIQDSEFRFICEPWRFQIRNSLVSLGRPDPVACQLDLVVGNIENYWGDFRRGGLVAMGVSIHNNYFRDYINMQTELFIEAMKTSYLQEKDVSPGGFINIKRCVEEVEDPFTGRPSVCVEWEIVTPGRAIGDMLSEAIFTRDIKYLINAEEVSAFLAIIVDAGIGRLIGMGINGIAGLAEKIASSHGTDGEIPIPNLETDVYYICDEISKVCSAVFEPPLEDEFYTSLEGCLESCGEDEDTGTFNDNTLACGKNVFVRARPPANCIDKVCPRCTGIGGTFANDCCFVFCKHTKDAEWKANTTGKQFTSSQVDPVCNFFGLSSPSGGCLCQTDIGEYPFYNNDYVGKFTNDCFECSEETYFGANLCRRTAWCEGGGGENEEEEEETPNIFVDIKDNYGSDGPETIPEGDSVIIAWTSQNVIECFASGAWAGYRDISGVEAFDNIESNRFWTLTCKDSSGNETSDTYKIFISNN